MACGTGTRCSGTTGWEAKGGGERPNPGSIQAATFIGGISGKTISGPAQPVLVNAQGQLGTNSGAAASTASLAATVERLQRQVRRLRERVKGG